MAFSHTAVATAVLVCSLLLAVLFAVIAGTFHGFVKRAADAAPDLDTKSAKRWVDICMWLAIIFGILSLGSAYVVAKKRKSETLHGGEEATPPTEPPDSSAK